MTNVSILLIFVLSIISYHFQKLATMKITKRLQDAVRRAQATGLTHMVITKGGSKWGTAYDVEPFSTFLKLEIGDEYYSGSPRGFFPTKNNPLPAGGIQYQNLLRWFSDDESAKKFQRTHQ